VSTLQSDAGHAVAVHPFLYGGAFLDGLRERGVSQGASSDFVQIVGRCRSTRRRRGRPRGPRSASRR
jgi:hypothetical protein